MAWKIASSGHSNSFEKEITGNCKIHNESATVTVRINGNRACQTDLCNTYHIVGTSCSLLRDKKGAYFSSCMEECHLIKHLKKYYT